MRGGSSHARCSRRPHRFPAGNVRKQRSLFVRIGFYEREGYEAIRQAMDAVDAVLDPTGTGSRGGPLDDGRYYHMRYFDTLLQGSRDDTIVSADSEAGVSYEACRYRVEISRP